MINYTKGRVLSMKSESILACTLNWQRECNSKLKRILPSFLLLAEYPQCFGASCMFIWFPLMSEKVDMGTYIQLFLGSPKMAQQ